MRTAFARARIEPKLKEKAENIFKHIGINPADAIRLFYRQTVLRRGIPFDLRIPRKDTLSAVRELESNKTLKRYRNAKEMFSDLEND
jgi:DNA-damage-inducible protein J